MKKVKPEWRQWLDAIFVAGLVCFILKTSVFGTYSVPTGSAIYTILPGDKLLANKFSWKFGLDTIKKGDVIVFDDQTFTYDKSSTLKYLWQKYAGIPLLGILPAGPDNITKRIIACPGDMLEGKLEDGRPVIYVNGKKLHEPYLNPYPLIYLKKEIGFIPYDSIGPIPIPGFLQKKTSNCYCAYDPHKSFADQPFFNMKPEEILYHPLYPELTFRMPFTPSYKDVEQKVCADVFGPIRVPEGKYWGMGDNRKDSLDSRWFGFIDEDRIQGKVTHVICSFDSHEACWIFDLIKHPIKFFTEIIRWDRFFKPLPYEKEVVDIPDQETMLRNIALESVVA